MRKILLVAKRDFLATVSTKGFIIAIFGHIIRARWFVAIGIGMIVLATLIFPLTRVATEETPPRPQTPGLE